MRKSPGRGRLTRLQGSKNQCFNSEFYQTPGFRFAFKFLVAPTLSSESRNRGGDSPITTDSRLPPDSATGTGFQNSDGQIPTNGGTLWPLLANKESRVARGDPQTASFKFEERTSTACRLDRDTLDNVQLPRSGDAQRVCPGGRSELNLGADERYEQVNCVPKRFPRCATVSSWAIFAAH